MIQKHLGSESFAKNKNKKHSLDFDKENVNKKN